MTKTYKTGNTKTHEGELIAEYSDGCWRKENGFIAIRAPKWKEVDFTKENAHEMVKRGHESRAIKKREAIMRRAKEHLSMEASERIAIPYDVAAEAAAELYMEIFERDNPLRERVYAYERVGKDVGFVDQVVSVGGGQAIQVNINISEQAVDKVESQFKIIDAIYKELGEDN